MWPIDEVVFALGGKRRSHHARAVVTGAGSGIGRAFALELAARGGEVVCADIDKDRADETVRLIERQGGAAHAFFCDVSRREDVASLAEYAEEVFRGAPTLVINNAGVGIGGKPVGDIGFGDWEWALGINLWGVVHGCEIFAPRLRAAGCAREAMAGQPEFCWRTAVETNVFFGAVG
ncbi:SDR family NAD(P)-dependent oxidoreductase, partial [Nocardia sp. NPDC004722]